MKIDGKPTKKNFDNLGALLLSSKITVFLASLLQACVAAAASLCGSCSRSVHITLCTELQLLDQQTECMLLVTSEQRESLNYARSYSRSTLAEG